MIRILLILMISAMALPTTVMADDPATEPSTEPYRRGDGTSDSLTISPAVIISQPGQRSGEILVVNDSPRDRTVQVSADSFTTDEDGVRIDSVDGQVDERYNAANWFTFTPQKFDLGAGERQMVQWSYEIPSDALPGQYFAGVYFSFIGDEDELHTTGARLAYRIGTPILVLVPGELVRDIEISEFDVRFLNAWPIFTDFYQAPMSLRLYNAGNVHAKFSEVYKTRLHVEVRNAFFGQELVANVALDDGFVMPDAYRRLNGAYEAGPFAIFGIYTAKVGVLYDTDFPPRFAEKTFIVVNWLVFLVAFVVVLSYLLRRRIKAAARRIHRRVRPERATE